MKLPVCISSSTPSLTLSANANAPASTEIAYQASKDSPDNTKRDQSLIGLHKRSLDLREFKHQVSGSALLFATLGFSFLSLGAFIARALDTNVIPYIVTIDEHGVVRSEGLLESPNVSQLPEQVLSAQLCEFITQLRMVTPDKNLQRQAITHVFACLKRDSKVFAQLKSFYELHNPLNEKDGSRVSIKIANVIPLDKYSYQIDWVEERFDEDSHVNSHKMRALISYEISNGYHSDPKMLMYNPLNLFIKELVLSPIMA